MSRKSAKRNTLIANVSGQLGRDLSTWTVLFHAAVAERLGLGPTDYMALGLIEQRGSLTAGELAAITGLTTGAVTGLIDRLEHAGHLQRTKDVHDRRKVVLVVLPSHARTAAFDGVFASLGQAMTELCTRYSDVELAVISDFMTACTDMMRQETLKLRAVSPKAKD
jgi:DNA-binding MarR family transcriptional regulator